MSYSRLMCSTFKVDNIANNIKGALSRGIICYGIHLHEKMDPYTPNA